MLSYLHFTSKLNYEYTQNWFDEFDFSDIKSKFCWQSSFFSK